MFGSAASRDVAAVHVSRVRIPPWDWDYHSVNDSPPPGTALALHSAAVPPKGGRTAIPAEWVATLVEEYAQDPVWAPVQAVLLGHKTLAEVS